MITIITPTYNRAYILNRLYESLERQTSKDFLWIVVDDGSQDETANLIKEWKKNSSFLIEYYYRQNGGKHRAINSVIDLVSTNFVFIVDSDDYLCDDAIETINEWLADLDDDSIAGVSGTKGQMIKNQLEIIGEFPGQDHIIASNLERKKYNLLGDKAEIYRATLLKKYHFPEFEGEKFIPENTVWDRIALDGKKIIWYKKILVVCEYLDDGLTKTNGQKLFVENMKGYIESYNLLWKGLKFPYNYSAIAECYRKMKICYGSGKKIVKIFNLNFFQYLMIKVAYFVKKVKK